MAWVERSGNRHRVRHRVDGKIVTDSVYDSERLADLRAKELDVVAAIGAGKLLRDMPLTLGEWATAWLPSHLAGEATIAKYDSYLRNHILPVFADRPLDAIERNEIKAFVKQLKKKLAPSSVRVITTLLGLLLREAVRDRRILIDVSEMMRINVDPDEERPVATIGQVRMIAARMPRHTERIMIITAAFTGLRWGELAGLDRANVDLGAGILTVDKHLGSLHEVNGKRWLGPPKTFSSAREVHLPPFLVELLDVQLRSHRSPMLFCGEKGGWLWRTVFSARRWRPACDGIPRHGVPPVLAGMHFHDLRHTHRTWLEEDKIQEVAVMRRLGHKLPGAPGRYRHMTPPMIRPMLRALQDRWEDGAAGVPALV